VVQGSEISICKR